MKKLDLWLSEYSQGHKNKTNKIIHNICVPTVVFSVFGLLWSIPIPDTFTSIAYLNFATIFCAFVLFFYLMLGVRIAFFMATAALFLLWGVSLLAKGDYLLVISAFLFIAGWFGLFLGHKIEGNKPALLKSLLFMLIGPIWVLRTLRII